MLTAKPYAALIAIIAICALTGAAFVKGIGIGRKSEAARWQADLIESQQKAAKQAEAARATIAALEATKHENLIKGGEDIEKIRIVQAPARIEIQKQIVREPIYRECRASDSLLKLVNDARAGRGVRAEAVHTHEARVSGNAPPRF